MLSVVSHRRANPASAPADHRMASHPLVTAAANGRLPEWAVAGPRRREHMARVAELLDSWADALHLTDTERKRWRAAAYLHDALRDAAPDVLRAWIPTGDSMPDALLHGPAAAARLRDEGVDDEELLAAIAFHTVGDAGFDRLGRALYAADFLEPGRAFLHQRRAELRSRVPEELDAVVREVAAHRLRDLVDRRLPLDAHTVAFWNVLVEEAGE